MIGFYGYWVILTYLGVISAVAGIFFAINSNVKYAVICLMIAGVFDMFDGPVARHSKRNEQEKNFGIQLDSLADVIGFGVLPATIGYAIFTRQAYGIWGSAVTVIVMSAYVLAALIRLGYFNVTEMELQHDNIKRTHYLGLPVTLAAVIVPIVYSVCVFFDFPRLATVYGIMLVVLSALFLMKVKLPKFKIRHIATVSAVAAIPIVYMLLKG